MSHDATFGMNLADDGIGNFALVERISSPFGDKPKSPRKIGVPDCVAFLEKYTIWHEYMTPDGMLQTQVAVFWVLASKIRWSIIPLVA